MGSSWFIANMKQYFYFMQKKAQIMWRMQNCDWRGEFFVEHLVKNACDRIRCSFEPCRQLCPWKLSEKNSSRMLRYEISFVGRSGEVCNVDGWTTCEKWKSGEKRGCGLLNDFGIRRAFCNLWRECIKPINNFKGPVSPIRHCSRLLLFSNDEMISDWLFAYRGFPLFLVGSKRATVRSYLSLCWLITSIPIVCRICGSWIAFQKMPQVHL